MRILIESHHPAHIHFWKYPIAELQNRGHTVLMLSRDRDVMKNLLAAYDWIESITPRRFLSRNRFPLLEMVTRQGTLAWLINSFQPHVVASLMGSYCQSAALMGARNVIFTDSEFQHFNHQIAHPFADEIYTPHCFYKRLGRKQKYYNGIHELSFLDGRRFRPDPAVIRQYPELVHGKYIVIRLSAWNTFHDIHHSGFGDSLTDFIESTRDRYQIIISAEENSVPDQFRKYARQFKPEHFHHILAFSRFVLTEGASTASEAACLGVPAVCINSTEPRGYLLMLEREYGLVRTYQSPVDGLPSAAAWLKSINADSEKHFKAMRSKLIDGHCDVSEFVVQVMEASIRS